MKIDQNTKKEYTFNDPIHGSVKVYYQVIKDLIDTPEFQRLRRISQLGYTYTVFNNAKHDRFSHSLGAYELVRKIFKDNKSFQIIKEREQIITMIAVLLHDIGHGPFSHAFENIFDFNHEKMGIKVILDTTTQINKVLKKFGQDLPNEIAQLISKKHPNEILVSLISSDLDVDRMDYLLRDSYFSGSNLGIYDQFKLIRNMRVYKNKIVVREKALNSLESFFIARYHMFMQVYTHQVSQCFEVQSVWFLRRVAELFKKDYQFNFELGSLENILENNYNVHDFILLDDVDIIMIMKKAQFDKDPILSKTASNIINRKKAQYKIVKKSDAELEIKQINSVAYKIDYIAEPSTAIKIKLLTSEEKLINPAEASPILNGLSNNNIDEEKCIIYWI